MADLERGLKIHELETAESVSSSSYVAIDDGTNTKKVSIAVLNTTGSETAATYAQQAESYALEARNSATTAQTAAQSVTDAMHIATAQLQGYVDEADDAAAYAGICKQKIESLVTSDYAKLAQSYAVGATGYREHEDTDNAEYYAEQAGISADNASASASVALSAADEATPAAEQAVSAYNQILALLTLATFTVDFTTGNLMYDRNEAYNFEIDTDTGNLEWEVVTA